MTDYPAPETLSHKDLGPILDKLRLLLENLPNQLPSKSVSKPIPLDMRRWLAFSPMMNILKWREVELGHSTCILSIYLDMLQDLQVMVPILERGPAISIYDLLEEYRAEFPNDNMLKKWVIDVAMGAEKVYNTHQVTVSRIFDFINKMLLENLSDTAWHDFGQSHGH